MAHNHLPWFLQPHCGRTQVDVSVAWPLFELADGSAGYSADVPATLFRTMLRRAAAHAGYTGRAHDHFEYKTRDVTMTVPAASPSPCEPCAVTRRRLVEHRPMIAEGTLGHTNDHNPTLLVRAYRTERMPFCAFPCDAPLHSAVRRRRLELRVHARARLVFDVGLSMFQREFSVAPEPARRVRLEIDVAGALGGRDLDDLRRTVENTVHVVLLGMPRLIHRRTLPFNSHHNQTPEPAP
jgi:hypothetical protein